jgi:co-chaperonin GroES (HSP10)
MTGINPYELKIPYNQVLVKLPKPKNDQIHFKGGGTLYLDTYYEPAFHTWVKAEIIAVCSGFRGDGPQWIPQIEVKPGDIVICDYFQILNHMGDRVHKYIEHPIDKYIEYDGDYFVFIDYQELFAKDDLTPLNGYVIYEGVFDDVGYGEYKKEVLSEIKGKAVSVGEPNVSYPDGVTDEIDLNIGDIFYFTKGMYRKLEYDLHATHNKNLYLTQRRYVLAKI